MIDVEKIDGGKIMSFDDGRFEVAHEPAGPHGEVVAHHHDALNPAAVTFAQGGYQVGIGVGRASVQPLLELVENDDDFFVRAAPQRGERLDQRQSVREPRDLPQQAVQDPALGLVGRRFDVNGEHVIGQPWDQAGLEQRRFPAAGRPVKHADGKRPSRVGFFDARLPEANRIGQAVPIAWSREKVEKEVGVVFIERSQALGKYGHFPVRRRFGTGEPMQKVFGQLEAGRISVGGAFGEGLEADTLQFRGNR